MAGTGRATLLRPGAYRRPTNALRTVHCALRTVYYEQCTVYYEQCSVQCAALEAAHSADAELHRTRAFPTSYSYS